MAVHFVLRFHFFFLLWVGRDDCLDFTYSKHTHKKNLEETRELSSFLSCFPQLSKKKKSVFFPLVSIWISKTKKKVEIVLIRAPALVHIHV